MRPDMVPAIFGHVKSVGRTATRFAAPTSANFGTDAQTFLPHIAHYRNFERPDYRQWPVQIDVDAEGLSGVDINGRIDIGNYACEYKCYCDEFLN